MNSTNTSKFSRLCAVLREYADIPGSLITVLQKTQEIYGYLPSDALDRIAAQLHIPISKVMGVATFYTQFRFEPVGKYLITLCQGTACHVNGSDAIEGALSAELGITDGHTTADGIFTLKSVACLGCCSLSPVMMINGTAYGSLTPEKAVKIVNELKNAE